MMKDLQIQSPLYILTLQKFHYNEFLDYSNFIP